MERVVVLDDGSTYSNAKDAFIVEWKNPIGYVTDENDLIDAIAILHLNEGDVVEINNVLYVRKPIGG